MGFFFLCLFPHQRKDGISLDGLCRYLMELGTDITKQSLQERFTEKATAFMKSIVAHALQVRLKTSSIKFETTFNRILVADSTVFELPDKFQYRYRGSGGGASRAAIKVHYCFDILSGNIISIVNRQGINADQTSDLPDLHKNDLMIEDLGFFTVARFKKIELSGACFLSRLRFGVNILVKRNQSYVDFDILKEKNNMVAGEVREYQACIGHRKNLFVRLIIEKIDPQLAGEKRRKLKTDKHNKRKALSVARLKYCDLNVYVTNASDTQLTKQMVRKYYSLRWQVEIIFKAWKSIFKIDQVRSMKIERFECMHYGMLTLIILTTQLLVIIKKAILKYKIEISELKFFTIIKELMSRFNQAIKSKKKLRSYMDTLWKMIIRTCRKDQKTNKQTPFTILNLPS